MTRCVSQLKTKKILKISKCASVHVLIDRLKQIELQAESSHTSVLANF
jgi:hypothetical protein